MNKIENIVVEPVDALFGAQHRVKVTCLSNESDGEGDALDDTYFLYSTPLTDFYIYNGTDPSLQGKTGLVYVLEGDETASEVATIIAAAINAASEANKFHAKATGADVIIEAKEMGAPLSPAAAGTSGFTVAVEKLGFVLPLGYLDGDVEVGMEEQLFDVTAHQTGTQLLGQLRTGVTAGPITLTLKEAIASRLKSLLEKGIGVQYTPAGGEVVTAVGALAGSKQFGNVTADGGKLILHPTKNAADDYSGDLAFWLSYPKLNALTFSGEANKSIAVEFSIFLDSARVNPASLFVYGDHTQNFLK